MADEIRERLVPLAARWKKFTVADDGERVRNVEHSPTSELQRFLKELDEARGDVDGYVATLEKKYGLFETGDIGADRQAEPKDAELHQSLRALRQAYVEATAEVEDRASSGET